MKNLKLTFFSLVSLIVFSIIFSSCSEENATNNKYITELKASGTILFDENTKKFSQNSTKNESTNTTEHDIELSFSFNTPIPEFDTNEELINYLQINSSEINGKITLIIDSNVVYESIVVNGQKTNSHENEYTNMMKVDYPCSFDGLSHCTQDRIDALNWFETTLCIIDGIHCVAINFISCSVDNC